MNHSETVQWLCALRNHGAKFGVDRMALFAEALGHPERAFPSVLVAGSNGKGSTAAMLEAIYRANGLRTGLYTSPHLVRLGERVQVNRVPLGDEAICAYVEELAAPAARLGERNADDQPSFFEFMTAMAFLEFKRKNVDIGIVEVGLGGRLDATNILRPLASVITSISLEHTALLGDSVEKIAAEKGGIIKEGTPVALGLLPAGAERVLREIARERGASVFSVRERFGGETALFPETNLEGGHQQANAALALLATETLRGRFPVDGERARAALRGVAWPARWQTFPLSRRRCLVVDAAHNAECAAAIEPLLARLVRETGRAPLVVAGALGAERARPLLAVLARHARALLLVRVGQERACGFEELEACVPPEFYGEVLRSDVAEIFPAPGECALGGEGEAIVVAGSVYLAGEVLARFLPDSVGEPFLQDALTPPRV